MMSTKSVLTFALVTGTLLVAAATVAQPQSRARVGDLVEFVSGLGATLAEVVVGPDASGYVVIQVPTGKQIPVSSQKLRLIQRAGTPNVPVALGQPASWVDGHVRENGTVVKVNGNWCQVKTASATTVGWVECKVLRTGTQTAERAKASPASSAVPTAAAAKGPALNLQGSWENADGTVKLEVQAAGKCFISMGPMTEKCTYRQAGGGVTVTVDGENMALAANDDGSLSSVGDASAMMPIRLKKKK